MPNTHNLHVAGVQVPLIWEDRDQNLEILRDRIDAYTAVVDVLVLPETFTTGFSLKAERVAEQHDENMPTLVWMRSIAKERTCCITGSVIVKDGDHFYNRLYWVFPDGEFKTYDKRHLFSYAKEDRVFTPGKERLIVEYKGWRICPLICYDLRFPMWSRNLSKDGEACFDLLIYVANWPSVRRNVWNILLTARAMENQCYVMGVNRVGVDGNAISHSGDSMVLDAKGDRICTTQPGLPAWATEQLPMDDLEEFRERFPVIKDGDKDLIQH